MFLPAGQPQPLDEMLASLEGSGATVTEVRVITKTVKVEPEEEKDVKTHQAHLIVNRLYSLYDTHINRVLFF